MASGFQIAFFVIAFHFVAQFIARLANEQLSLPREQFNEMVVMIWVTLATVIIAAFPGLRANARRQLAVPVPLDLRWETAFIAAAKLAIPLAAIGAFALGMIFVSNAPSMLPSATTANPSQIWSAWKDPASVLLILVFTCALGPAVEEIVFRGWLFRAWERQWGWKAATVATAIAFGLCHPSSLVHMASTTLGSVVFTAILLRTGSLRACIAVHCAYNAVMQAPLFGQIVFRQRFGDYTGWQTWSLEWACLAFVAVALPAYLVLAARTRRDKLEAA
ncbi:MAG TPA: type II CAAX endopeptidase family protein [Usitatibacteraceae bacterium]|nr:type II CAAX endopeptidase family protein [Usitatibacteraceae bacterium]